MVFDLNSVNLYESFVEEYFRDYDPIAALLRLGFSYDEAYENLEKIFLSGVVQRAIMEYRENFIDKVKSDTHKFRSVLLERQYRNAITTDKSTLKMELPDALNTDKELGDVDEFESIDFTFTVLDSSADD